MDKQALSALREVFRERSKTFLATMVNSTRYYYDFIVERYIRKRKIADLIKAGV